MKLSFRAKVICFLCFASVLTTTAAVLTAKQQMHEDALQALINKSRAIITRLESARKFVAEQGLLEQTVNEILRENPEGDLSEEAKLKVLKAVPIFASLKIGMEDAAKDQYEFRVPAKEPRRKENAATPTELAFLEQFEKDPDLKELVHVDQEKNSVWVMRPIRISEAQGCLTCHGSPSKSPWKNGKDILGYPMENWKDGRMHGMFKISSSLEPAEAAAMASVTKMGFWSAGFAVFAILLVLYFLKSPMATLSRITQQLDRTAASSLESSQTLGATAQSVSSSTAEQAAAIQETMAAMTEMSSMVGKTIELAQRTQQVSNDLNETAKNGTQVMQGMVTSMDSIKSSNDELKKMVQIISDISSKTSVINDIVFKTQLLSVNASIEAARAGQHGKGFAVVAEEVGNLAQISGKAAEEIRDMLSKSQGRVEEIVSLTNDRVSEGEKVVQRAMSTFVEISNGIGKIQGYAQSVNEATTQQQEGITQISTAMSEMDKASQMNSHEASNVSDLSESLVQQSSVLEKLCTESQKLVFGEVVARGSEPDEETGQRLQVGNKHRPQSPGSLRQRMDSIKQRVSSIDPKALTVEDKNDHRDDFEKAA
jgi:methyl-accepting chemotaxis protein